MSNFDVAALYNATRGNCITYLKMLVYIPLDICIISSTFSMPAVGEKCFRYRTDCYNTVHVYHVKSLMSHPEL